MVEFSSTNPLEEILDARKEISGTIIDIDFALSDIAMAALFYGAGRTDKIAERMKSARDCINNSNKIHNSSGAYCHLGLFTRKGKVENDLAIERITGIYNKMLEFYSKYGIKGLDELKPIEFKPMDRRPFEEQFSELVAQAQSKMSGL